MFKFLLIVVLVIYALYRLSLFFGSITGQSAQGNQNSGGQVRVDKNPNEGKKKFNGGDYIDYEEVK